MKNKLYKPKPGNYVLLTIEDTGEGMDMETQERIFDPFFTTKDVGKGTGLGLASAYGIIKGHGGYIDVVSQKDRGTTFSIYLPATEEVIEQTAFQNQEIAPKSGTILVVDDEATVLSTAVKVLKKMGFTVLEAKTGKIALDIYKINYDRIDLIILDMIMPEMGGGEVYDRLKELNPEVKVLLASGYSIDSEAKQILSRGCDEFIQKPFTLKELSQSIQKVLDKR